MLTAEYQSAARGRLDRHWEAPARSSVSVSLVLRPVNAEGRPLPTQSYSWLSLLAALALREALLETAGIPAELKWPNDVLVRGPEDRRHPGPARPDGAAAPCRPSCSGPG